MVAQLVTGGHCIWLRWCASSGDEVCWLSGAVGDGQKGGALLHGSTCLSSTHFMLVWTHKKRKDSEIEGPRRRAAYTKPGALRAACRTGTAEARLMCQVVTQLRINAAIMCWAKNRLHGICFSLVPKASCALEPRRLRVGPDISCCGNLFVRSRRRLACGLSLTRHLPTKCGCAWP